MHGLISNEWYQQQVPWKFPQLTIREEDRCLEEAVFTRRGSLKGKTRDAFKIVPIQNY